ncbi:MAG: triose-phosphate isomerase [Candidatus Omnitrophota bacterium]|nr:triose-phosphate isomerase [Candidatus Omnitrophota bacterium]
MFKRLISLALTLSFGLQQTVFAYTASLNLSGYLNQGPNLAVSDRFRPINLRYFSYQPLTNDFKILLDKGDSKDITDTNLKGSASVLLDYFKIGLSLPNDKFWVNLRPDSQDQIIDDELAKTDLGKVMLEADLKLKQDTALFTSPQTPQGKEYWNKLYQRAGELFGTENITIPTLTRPWIVPGEIILRESQDNSSKTSQGAYIYKANLKVMLEEDYLSHQPSAISSQQYNFSDPRLKELNQYSTQLIRELILPKLTQKVNSSKDYANLRQVYFSLILASWFKETFKDNQAAQGDYLKLINSHNLTNLSSKQAWDKTTYFNAYQKSFQEGEYNLSEPVYTPTGQVIRRYMSGGIAKFMPKQINNGLKINSSPIMPEDKVLLMKAELNIQKSTAAEAPVELTTPKMAASAIEAGEEKANFLKSLTGIIQVTSNYIIILNEPRFKSEGVEILAKAAAVAANPDVKASARRILQEIGLQRGIIPASINSLYREMAKKDSTLKKFTVPAFNIRTLTLESMRRILREAKRIDAGAIILELALSEKGYTAQPPAEYWAIANAAAIMENYYGHIFLQADHYQKNAEKYVKNRDEVREKSFKEIKEAIEGGYYGIDSDNSTIVPSKEVIEDLEGEVSTTESKAKETAAKLEVQKKLLEYADEIFARWSNQIAIKAVIHQTANTLKEYNQQGYYARIINECDQKLAGETKADKKAGLIKLRETIERFTQRIKEDPSGLAKEIVRDQIINAQETAMDTLQVRALEPKGITVTVGGEIGEVGKKNSEPGEFAAFIDLYNQMLGFMKTKIIQGKESEIIQIVGASKEIWSKEVLDTLKIKYYVYKGVEGLRKIAIQTGTAHGVGGQIDFETIKALAEIGKKYGVVVVQHGASTLPESEFSKIMENGAGEVHLATDYMTVVLRDLRTNHQDVYQAILKDSMEKTKKSEDELWEKPAEFRNSLTLIKESVYNLPKESQERIGDQLALKFSNTMRSLGVENTKTLVKTIVQVLPPALPARPQVMQEMFSGVSSAITAPKENKEVFNRYGLKVESMEAIRLDVDTPDGNLPSVDEALKDSDVRQVVLTSAVQGLAGFPDVGIPEGIGKEEISKRKEVIDSKAGQNTVLSILDYTRANPNVAMAVVAEEGVRDGVKSILPIGRIYWSGYTNGYQDPDPDPKNFFKTYKNEILRLREKSIRVRFVATDGVEHTNGMVGESAKINPTSTWSVTSFIDNDRDVTHAIWDNARVWGPRYNASTDAGVEYSDLPSEAIDKIVRALAKEQGIGFDDAEALEAFKADYINNLIFVALGERTRDLSKADEQSGNARHGKIIDDAKKLREKYPNLTIRTPGDGNLIPSLYAILGLKMDGKHMIVIDRMGSAEAKMAYLIAKLARNGRGQFTHKVVSEKMTSKSVNKETALQFTEEDISEFRRLGYSEKDYTQEHKTADFKGEGGIFAATAITGAAPDIYGKTFAELLSRITIERKADSSEGVFITNTIVVTKDGAFAVKTKLSTDNVNATIEKLKNIEIASSAIEATEEKANFTKSLTGIIKVTPNNIIILNEPRFKSEGAEILAKAAAVANNPDVKASARRILQEIGLQRGIIPASINSLYKKMAKEDSALKKFTVPAFNIRTLTLESMRRIFREAGKINAGAIIFELALSEKGYTAQPPAEYWAIATAAAIMEGYQGRIFLQADHYQKNAEKYVKSRDEVREKSFKEIKEAIIEGGYYGIDSDNSTLVPNEEVRSGLKEDIEDLEGEVSTTESKTKETAAKLEVQKKLLEYADEIFARWSTETALKNALNRIMDETANTLFNYTLSGYYARIINECDQKLASETKADKKAGLLKLRETMERFTQRIKEDTLGLAREIVRDQIINAQETAMDTLQVRALEPKGITVTVGGEIGEVGKKNSEPGEFVAFIELYNAMLGFMKMKIAQGKESEILQIVGASKEIWSKEVLDALKTKYNQYQNVEGLRKIAIQTGTAHGVGGQIDFATIKALAEIGKEYGVVVVQHGASTLPESEFSKIMENGAGEVHLATDYMTVVLRDLKANHQDVYQAILKDSMSKTGKSEDALWEKAAEFRNSLTLIKESVYNLPKESQERIGDQLAIKFSHTMRSLAVENTGELVKEIIPLLVAPLSSRPQAMQEMFSAASAIVADEVDKDPITADWIDRVKRHAWLKSRIEYIEKELEKAPDNTTLRNNTEPTKNELKVLGNPNDSIPAALKKAEEQKREYVIGGNWKMAVNTEDDALRIVRGIVETIKQNRLFVNKDNIDIVIPIAPSFVHISAVNAEIKRLGVEGIIRLAAQDVSLNEPGAWTSQVSAKQLKSSGVEYVILGHSERRRSEIAETSESVNKKVKLVLQEGLLPIVCVGETLDEREAGKTFSIIAEQTLDSLKDLTPEQIQKIIIAYEPVWAIGTGKTATPEQANEVHRFIRALLLNTYGYETASKMPIQYGGSVKADNIASLIAQPSIDGGLIGGASLKIADFVKIIEESLKHFRAASSAMMTKEAVTNPGGIDLRTMNMLIQPQGSFASSSLDFSLPSLSKAEIESFDLDTELAAIQKMVSSGMAPSDERLKEYLAVCFARQRTGREIDSLKLCLLDVFEQQQLEAKETPNGYKEVLVIADTRGYVLKEGRFAASKQNTVSLN